MRAYGKKKTHTHVAGHQRCGVCHAEQKSMRDRARKQGFKDGWDACAEWLLEIAKDAQDLGRFAADDRYGSLFPNKKAQP